MTRLVTAVAVYVALVLTITAGIELRVRDGFRDAPVHHAAFLAALDRGSARDATEAARWFTGNGPASSRTRASISLATSAAEDGEFDLARRFVRDLPAAVERDQANLDRETRQAWSAAWPWLVLGGLLGAVAIVLRGRRRAASAEVVELVSRFVPPRPRWRRPVFLVVTSTGYLVFVAGFLGIVAATRAYRLSWAVRGWLLVGGVVALVLAYWVLKYSRPRSARGAVQALRADSRRPVLYLRGFGDDRHAARIDEIPGALAQGLVGLHSREEQLVGALGAFGPVIAVGRPGEPLPHLGAARFYLPFDDWQPGVRRLMDLSQLIVLRLGEGEGLWWEVEQASTTQPPAKLVLLLPGEHDGPAQRLDEHLPKPVGLRGVVTGQWTSAVVVFDRDWNPHVEAVGPFPGEKNNIGPPVFHVARALQRALASAGTRKRALGPRSNRPMLAVFAKAALLVPAGFLAVHFLRFVFLW